MFFRGRSASAMFIVNVSDVHMWTYRDSIDPMGMSKIDLSYSLVFFIVKHNTYDISLLVNNSIDPSSCSRLHWRFALLTITESKYLIPPVFGNTRVFGTIGLVMHYVV